MSIKQLLIYICDDESIDIKEYSGCELRTLYTGEAINCPEKLKTLTIKKISVWSYSLRIYV